MRLVGFFGILLLKGGCRNNDNMVYCKGAW